MRTRKAVITVACTAVAVAAFAGAAASPALAAPATAATYAPHVGFDVGGGLLTRQSLSAGQWINLLGLNGGRFSSYRVTSEQREGDAYYVTVWPRLQTGGASQLLFETSN
jgi:hypothetical protein